MAQRARATGPEAPGGRPLSSAQPHLTRWERPESWGRGRLLQGCGRVDAATYDVGRDHDVEVGLGPGRVLGIEERADDGRVAEDGQLVVVLEIALLGEAADDEAL